MRLIEQLRADFPQFSFVIGDENLWLPEEKRIICRNNDAIGALHELGHALSGHKGFIQDIELLKSERQAWDAARELGAKYGVKIDDNRVEASLDWYRGWLHQRSVCPVCGQNAPQERSTGRYKCLNCAAVWHTNDARMAALRRYKAKSSP
jgi:ribosomal protein L37AE/L43A